MITTELTPLQNWFLGYVAPIILSFLAVVVPVLSVWFSTLLKKSITQMETNHAANVAANKVAEQVAVQAVETAQVANAKMDTVIKQTNGVTEKLQEHIDSQADLIVKLGADRIGGTT